MLRLRHDQVDIASRTLTVAFQDDPLASFLEPDARKRGRVLPWFFSVAIRYGLPFGQVWANDDASAVAVWLPPEGTHMTAWGMLRAGMARLPLMVGLRGALRVIRSVSATEPFHRAVEGPHWYLVVLGTRPEQQGRGLGSALLDIGAREADAAGVPCYLETATDENVRFYSKRGFQVTGEVEVLGSTVRAMVRPPIPVDPSDSAPAFEVPDDGSEARPSSR